MEWRNVVEKSGGVKIPQKVVEKGYPFLHHSRNFVEWIDVQTGLLLTLGFSP